MCVDNNNYIKKVTYMCALNACWYKNYKNLQVSKYKLMNAILHSFPAEL